MRVEVRLRVPNMKPPVLNENGYPINHQEMRFRNVVDVPELPKPSAVLELPTQSGRTISAVVVRTDWSSDRVIVSCQFARRGISAEEYAALADDPAWELKHLLD
jgi:hypothetical protein